MSESAHTGLVVAIRSPLNMEERRAAIRETWGKDFSNLGANVFFILSGDALITKPTLKGDLLYTPGFNTHRDLTNRMCWLWKYLSNLSYSHVLVMDDDCSVNVPLFMSLNWKNFDAWGHNNGGYLSGSAAVFSRAAIEKLNYNMPKDDVVIGAVLSHLKINLTHAGRPCPIKPWASKNGAWKFGDSEVAIEHYIRTADQIRTRHEEIKGVGFSSPTEIEGGQPPAGFSETGWHSWTSKIYIDKNKKQVKKVSLNLPEHQKHDLIKREIRMLGILNSADYKWAPRLIHADDRSIVTEYCGEPVNYKNIPSDYIDQTKKIIEDMKKLHIKHNDIKAAEILVKDGKIYLCDFGWASINDDFSCGIDISDKKKFHGVFDDNGIFKILKKIYKEKIEKTPTSQRRNNSGSQSEAPKVEILKETVKVSGYQAYEISIKTGKVKYLCRHTKYNEIKRLLTSIKKECVSISDIGCSGGIISYTASELGYEEIYALDHDQEYLDLIDKVNSVIPVNPVKTRKFSFGDQLPETDIIFMGALIHWVYSCTALYGNFDKIFSYLGRHVNKYLIVEWVDDTDISVKAFGHIKYNKDLHSEEYNRGNFEKGLKKNIGEILLSFSVTDTRQIYFCKKG